LHGNNGTAKACRTTVIMTGAHAITLHVTRPSSIRHNRHIRHDDGTAAAAAAGRSDGDGTVAMLCVVIDPNSSRGRASHGEAGRAEHNQPASVSQLDERMTINHSNDRAPAAVAP